MILEDTLMSKRRRFSADFKVEVTLTQVFSQKQVQVAVDHTFDVFGGRVGVAGPPILQKKTALAF